MSILTDTKYEHDTSASISMAQDVICPFSSPFMQPGSGIWLSQLMRCDGDNRIGGASSIIAMYNTVSKGWKVNEGVGALRPSDGAPRSHGAGCVLAPCSQMVKPR